MVPDSRVLPGSYIQPRRGSEGLLRDRSRGAPRRCHAEVEGPFVGRIVGCSSIALNVGEIMDGERVITVQRRLKPADRAVLVEHLRRIEHAAETDSAQAIGSAKELVESATRLVLKRFGEEAGTTDSVQQLVKRAMTCLNSDLEDLPNVSRG